MQICSWPGIIDAGNIVATTEAVSQRLLIESPVPGAGKDAAGQSGAEGQDDVMRGGPHWPRSLRAHRAEMSADDRMAVSPSVDGGDSVDSEMAHSRRLVRSFDGTTSAGFTRTEW